MKRDAGVTLVEILVAIVVLSVGLLGIAGLQSAVAQYQLGSQIKGSLSPLVSDLASRIRANAEAAGNNAQTGTPGISQYISTDTWTVQQADSLTIARDCETSTISCTNDERAAYDMAAWRRKVRAAMPQGAAMLSGSRSQGFLATIMWMDKNLNDKGTASDSVLAASPVCSTAAEIAGANRMQLQNCCPSEAQVPDGVRCNRFSFIP